LFAHSIKLSVFRTSVYPTSKVGDRFLHLSCQGGNWPLCHSSVTPLAMMYCIYIK